MIRPIKLLISRLTFYNQFKRSSRLFISIWILKVTRFMTKKQLSKSAQKPEITSEFIRINLIGQPWRKCNCTGRRCSYFSGLRDKRLVNGSLRQKNFLTSFQAGLHQTKNNLLSRASVFHFGSSPGTNRSWLERIKIQHNFDWSAFTYSGWVSLCWKKITKSFPTDREEKLKWK